MYSEMARRHKMLRILSKALPRAVLTWLQQASHELDSSHQRLAHDYEAVTVACEELRQQARELNDRLQCIEAEAQRLREGARQIEGERTKLTAAYAVLETNTESLKRDRAEILAELTELRKEVAVWRDRYQRREVQYAEATRKSDEFETKVAKLQLEMVREVARRNAVEKEHVNAERLCAHLEQDLLAGEQELGELRTLASVSEARCSDYEHRVAELKRRVAELEAVVSSSVSEREHLEVALGGQESVLLDLRKQNDELREGNDRLLGLQQELVLWYRRQEKTLEQIGAATGFIGGLSIEAVVEHKAALEALGPYVKKNFPVYLGEGYLPRAHPSTGVARERLMILSIPKAGTYLFSKLLSELGFVPTNLHLNVDGFTDYRFTSLREAKEQYLSFNVDVPLRVSIKLIGDGQFAVGHLPHQDEVLKLLEGFKLLFIRRDLRDALVSQMRFFSGRGRGQLGANEWKRLPEGPDKLLGFWDSYGEPFMNTYRSMLGWHGNKGVFEVSFEEICGDLGEERQQRVAQKLVRYLGIRHELINVPKLLSRVIGARTQTWSGQRTDRRLYWSDDLEQRFLGAGGQELNKKLGYR